MYLKLAWRNIWRNKKRTLISVFSIFLAVSLSVFVRSQYLGSYESMMQNTVGSFLGYIQIQKTDKYVENPNLEKTFQDKPKLRQKIKLAKAVKNIIPRLELTSFVGNQEKKKVGFILGIDAKKEKHLSNPTKRLIKGKYFEKNREQTVILAEKLAKVLKLKVGDSLEILAKDFQAKPIQQKFLVKGIAKIPQPELNQKLVYLPLKTCQDFFQIQNHISSYILDIDNFKNTKKVCQKLQKEFKKEKLKVITWDKSNPELKQILLVQDITTSIVVFVLYMIVGFGIFGTILMMLTERQMEFKTIISIGLKRYKLALMLFTEVVLLGILGILISNLLVVPLLFYFNQNPIQLGGEMAQLMQEVGMPAQIHYSINSSIFLNQSLIIFSLNSLLALYIFRYVKKLKLIKE